MQTTFQTIKEKTYASLKSSWKANPLCALILADVIFASFDMINKNCFVSNLG